MSTPAPRLRSTSSNRPALCGMLPTVAVMFDAPLSSATMVAHPTFDIRSAAAVAHLLKVISAVDANGAASLRRLLISTGTHEEGLGCAAAASDGTFARVGRGGHQSAGVRTPEPWRPRHSGVTKCVVTCWRSLSRSPGEANGACARCLLQPE